MTDHPMEGKYFGFSFQADYTEDTYGMAIMQVKKGTLDDVWHPCDNSGSIDNVINTRSAEKQAIEFLKKNGVKELYTPDVYMSHATPEIFLGRTLRWDNENGWGDYLALDSWYYGNTLKEEGIELKPYKE